MTHRFIKILYQRTGSAIRRKGYGMRRGAWLLMSVLLFSVLYGCSGSGKEKPELMLYCAAGMKPPVEKIVKQYEKEYGVDVMVQYGGSGTLLSNIRVVKNGDLYLAADKSYIEKAREYGLIDEVMDVAHLTPVIIVKKGNPKNIHSLKDLLRDDVRLCIANPSAASVGRLTQKMLEENGMWDKVQKNIKVLKPTVNDVANDVKIGSVDAGIVWDATGNQYSGLENIPVPEFKKHTQTVSVAILKSTKDPTAALKFARYLTARDRGLEVFREFKYEPVEGDIWEETPKIVFYSGGVNRIVIDSTIRAFEKREGVEVVTVYNGCGILVSQIKAGQKPDAYLTCDTLFMNQVKDEFTDIKDVSQTQIVIITDKENSKNIRSMRDLAKPGLKVGMCNPKQSALGTLTMKLLQGCSVKDKILANVRSQTPTADLLVNQMRTGSLDAAIVYKANTAKVKDKFTIVPIDMKEANATQNLGVNIYSKHKKLMERFFDAITSEESKHKYEENGFQWKFRGY